MTSAESLINVIGCAEMGLGRLIGRGTGVLGASFAVSGLPEGRAGGFRADSSSWLQSPTDHEQVAEGEQREELGAAFSKAEIAGL